MKRPVFSLSLGVPLNAFRLSAICTHADNNNNNNNNNMTELQVLVCPKNAFLFTVHYRWYCCLPWQGERFISSSRHSYKFVIYSSFLLNDKW
jgi:hypothetical protein